MGKVARMLVGGAAVLFRKSIMPSNLAPPIRRQIDFAMTFILQSFYILMTTFFVRMF